MRQSIFLFALVACSLTLYSCKDKPGYERDPLEAELLTYMTRVIDVDLSKTDMVHVPVKDIYVDKKIHMREKRIGIVSLDHTTAIEYVQFAFPEEDGPRTTDSTFTFPIKLYPSRITEPVTITMVERRFKNESWRRPNEYIDTITINLIPAKLPDME